MNKINKKKLKLLEAKYKEIEALRDKHKIVADLYADKVHNDNNDLMTLQKAIYKLDTPSKKK